MPDVCDAAADVPVVLLPVRLETRFGTDDDGTPVLKVRIYPDDVHVDNLDRGVDDDEAAAGRAWWSAVWHTPDPLPPKQGAACCSGAEARHDPRFRRHHQ